MYIYIYTYIYTNTRQPAAISCPAIGSRGSLRCRQHGAGGPWLGGSRKVYIIYIFIYLFIHNIYVQFHLFYLFLEVLRYLKKIKNKNHISLNYQIIIL